MTRIVDENDAAVAALQEHLAELQLAQIAHGRRVIIIFEGPTGSGKKLALRRLTAALDPCNFVVHATQRDRREAAEGHWLARFWRQLPAAGNSAIFFRSWYRRVLDDRIGGLVDEAAIARAYDEINEFEAQQRDYGTLIVKLYFDVSARVQADRLARRAADPWWRVTRRDHAIDVTDPAYSSALADLRRLSDTRWSPWRMIDGNDEAEAVLSALSVIAAALEESLPAEPPRLVEPSGRAA